MQHDDLPRLLDEVRKYVDEYQRNLKDRRVFPDESALAGLQSFDEPLPDGGTESAEVLAQLHQYGTPATVAQTSGRYFGFVNGGLLPVGLGARWMADVWNQNTALYVMSPVNARLEQVCEQWLAELLGLPRGTAAGFVTGTMMANLTGLCAGRNELLRQRGWDVASEGLWGAPPFRIIVGEGAHAAVTRAVSILGLGTRHIETVPMDSHGRMRADLLPDLDESALVVAQVGNVNSGAIDPVGEICRRTKESGSWVHVDGAFGLWARVLPRLAEVCEGLELADSWAADAHKTLNVPYDHGLVLCRDRDAMHRAFEASGSYLQWSDQRDSMRHTPSMSKRGRAIELWAVLKNLGRNGVVELVEQLCSMANHMAESLERHGFEICNEVVFNQVLVACEDDQLTKETLRQLQSGGECWCGGSQWQGRSVIRISVSDWTTSRAEVARSVAAFVTARDAAKRTG